MIERQQKIKFNLRQTVTTLENKLRAIQESNKRNREDIVCRIYAEKIIKKFILIYELKKVPKDKNQKDYVWSINLAPGKGKLIISKEVAGIMFFGIKKNNSKSERNKNEKKIRRYRIV